MDFPRRKGKDMTLKEMRAAYAQEVAAAEALVAAADESGDELTEEQSAQIDAHIAKSEALGKSIDQREKLNTAAARKFAERQTSPDAGTELPGQDHQDEPRVLIPATVRQSRRLTSFHGKDANLDAYKAAQWFRAVLGIPSAIQYSADYGLGVPMAVQSEGVNTAGGYSVVPEIESRLIDLQELYGVFRQHARIVPMTTDQIKTNRIVGSLTHGYTGEGAAATASDITLDQITLSAKKGTVMSIRSNELDADSMIAWGDEIVNQAGIRIAEAEDTAGFTGTGTSDTAGITGLTSRLTAATKSLITGASGTHTDWSGITLGKLEDMVGLLPQYADIAGAVAWFCHKTFFNAVMKRLLHGAGGNTVADLQGRASEMFLGYPVAVVQKMPKAAGTAEVVCAFGNLSQAASFGDRQGMEIAFSTEGTVGSVNLFETSQMAVRVNHRYDINVHDVGDTNDEGSVVGLLTSA